MTTTRRPLIALALSLAALLVLPAAGQAATEFGSRLNHDPANSGECESLGSCTIVSYIHPSGPEGDPYAGGAPTSGVITEFRIRAYVPAPSAVTFRLADINLPDPNDPASALATAAATGPTVTLQPTEEPEAPIVKVPARTPVTQGQHLAIDGTNVQATVNDSGSKFSYVFTPPLVAGSGARGSLQATGELLVAATIEPDADGDGFGDETQDGCPRQASTQGACDDAAPGVQGLRVGSGKVRYTLSEAATVKLKLAKRLPGRRVGGKCVKQTAKNKAKKRCARFRRIGKIFSGPGGQGANLRALPGFRKLGPGRYRLTLTAIDAAGNKTVKNTGFTVKRKKKKA